MTSYLDTLNDRQREAATCVDGPLMILAGAGSGKTKTLTTRMVHLIEEYRVQPHRILAMTFTNKAAGEMRERVQRSLAERHPWGGRGLEIGTFHSVCVRLLRREASRLPFEKSFVIYDDSDQLSLVKSVMEKLSIDDKAFNPKGIQGAINRAKCDAIEPHELSEGADSFDLYTKQVRRVYEAYQKALFANSAIDFGEILCMTYRLLRDDMEVRTRYQNLYSHLHVDEYQDTNRVQYKLLSLLAHPSQGGHQNICVVGDEDQSIYKWRGADIRNILEFEQDYPGACVVKLEQNYRSTKNIIAAAGHVIRNNTTRKDKTLWTDNEEGLPVFRTQLADERAEADWVISEVRRLAANDGRAYGDFAIFYRTNAQSRQFEDVLRREKFPYQIVGGLRFYDRKEIKDILAYFRVIQNPLDSVSLRRIVNVPGRGIGKTTLDRVAELQTRMEQEQARMVSYWEALQRAATDPDVLSRGASQKLAGFVKIIEGLAHAQPHLLVSELYHQVLDETGYVSDLKSESTEESLARVENLEEFDTVLQEFEEGNETERSALLTQFLEQISLAGSGDETGDDQSPQASSVKLMTLHSSKGLEFPVVFLVGMEEGLFPSIKPWEPTPEDDIEEERRLCYVGMTRAREVLYLTNAVMRRLWGQTHFHDPSRFFAEIPDELVQMRDLSVRQQSPTYGGGYLGNQTSRFASFGTPSRVGKRLVHPEYGEGRVIGEEGSGEDQRVTIEFYGQVRKKFIWRYVASFVYQ